MKLLRRLIIGFGIMVLAVVAIMYAFNYDYLLRAIRTVYFHGHVTAFPDDYKYFDNDTIAASNTPQAWKISNDYNHVAPTQRLATTHRKTGTIAFLIIRNDSIWNEHYYEGYGKNARSNSFSMAKSIVCAALGKAIMQHKIKSLDQKVGDFFPEFKFGRASRLTVGDLASMASGLDWDESYYSPFSITTRAYFDRDLTGMMLGLKVTGEPGTQYTYLSGNTQLLAMCIEKATGMKIARYVAQNLWQPLGAENTALWETDHEGGLVKAYCCIASTARDFARFGKLYRDFGRWKGAPVLDSAFAAKSITPRFKDTPFYGYGWWLFDYRGKHGFYMRGHLGQYVIVVPEDDLIIVRLGAGNIRSTTGDKHSDDFYIYVSEAYAMLSKKQ